MSSAPHSSCLLSADLSLTVTAYQDVSDAPHPLTVYWLLFCSVFTHQDVSAASYLSCLLSADPSCSVSDYQVVSATSCSSCLLFADFSFALSLLISMWVLPLNHFIHCLLTSHSWQSVSDTFCSSYVCLSLSGSVYACQCVSAALYFSCLLSADFFLILSLLTSMWVLHLVHPICWLTSLCLPGCECCPLFIPFAASWLLAGFVSACQCVSAALCLSYFLLNNISLALSLPASVWVPLILSISAGLTLALLTSMWVLHIAVHPILCCWPLSLLASVWVLLLIHTICYLSLTLTLLVSVWVLALVYPIYCLFISLMLSMHSRLWVLPLIHPAGCWTLSHSVSAWQDVSATPCLSCFLMTSLTLSLLARMWVLPIHLVFCLLTSLWLCLCLLACECYLSFILFAVCCLLISVSTYQRVSATPHPSCLLFCWLFSCTVSAHQLVCFALVDSICCLLKSLLFCLCSSGCECCPLLVPFTVYWPLSLCLSLPGCQLPPFIHSICCLLTSLSLVTACQLVSAGPHSSHSLFTELCLLPCQLVSASSCLSSLLYADLSLALSLLISLWVLHLTCLICHLIIILSLCCCLSDCECCTLFIPFAAWWPHFISAF